MDPLEEKLISELERERQERLRAVERHIKANPNTANELINRLRSPRAKDEREKPSAIGKWIVQLFNTPRKLLLRVVVPITASFILSFVLLSAWQTSNTASKFTLDRSVVPLTSVSLPAKLRVNFSKSTFSLFDGGEIQGSLIKSTNFPEVVIFHAIGKGQDSKGRHGEFNGEIAITLAIPNNALNRLKDAKEIAIKGKFTVDGKEIPIPSQTYKP